MTPSCRDVSRGPGVALDWASGLADTGPLITLLEMVPSPGRENGVAKAFGERILRSSHRTA